MTYPSLTRRMSGIVAMVAGGLLLLTALTPQGVLAHERVNVGKYQFVIGWISEPPLTGIKNSLDLGIYDITNVSSPRAILNAQNNLTVKFLYGSQVFPVGLVPAFQKPGKYVGDIIPTAAGTYRVNFTGRVESQGVNFTRALEDVAWPTALEFPNPRPTPENISKVANGAQLTATFSLILGAGGVILGAAGLAVAFLSRRKHREG